MDDFEVIVESHLGEMVDFSRRMLDDLSRAHIEENWQGYKSLSVINLDYSADSDNYAPHEDSDTLARHEPYKTSSPYITRAFRYAFVKLMEDSGYHYKEATAFEQITPDTFCYDGIFSKYSILNFRCICNTTPDKLREAFLTARDDKRLTLICCEALQRTIHEMKAFARPEEREDPTQATIKGDKPKPPMIH